MKAIIPEFSPESREPLYLQLYNYIKKQILSNEIVYGEKLPSLRNLSETLSLSITTVEQAYAQLAVEGYVESRPCSGYYVSEIFLPEEESELFNTHSEYFLRQKNSAENYDEFNRLNMPHMIYDLSSFNWNRWKKCINKVITDYPENLLFESDPQGEKALRYEISKYIYESRGVKSNLEQIVIAAGTQQITSHLSNILRLNSIENISVESPGYMLVTNIFKDRGFAINPIDVSKDGINIGRLPWNIASAVYVNPSNQFPTGAVMPVAKRYQLLDWAKKNNSYIIEDDYDSELRYFGKPLPPLKSLFSGESVIYLGSFSSTLFPAAKISYMVLPENLAATFDKIKANYSQTCSKTEQLALAFYMKEGWFQTGIKKLRKSFSVKLIKISQALEKYGKNFIAPLNTKSGISIIIKVYSPLSSQSLSELAKDIGLIVLPAENVTQLKDTRTLILYYNYIPKEDIDTTIEKLIKRWKGL